MIHENNTFNLHKGSHLAALLTTLGSGEILGGSVACIHIYQDF
jgi:hypothetical protein